MSRRGNGKPDVGEAGNAIFQQEQGKEPPSPFTCPECGGALWEKKDGKIFRYQCHVGHSYTSESLVSEKTNELETVLWSAVRALEENAELRFRMARRAAKGPLTIQQMGHHYEQQGKEAQQRAAILREVLTNGKSVGKMARSSSAEKKARRARSQSVRRAKGNGRSRRRTSLQD
jgi:two-component system chemotaxis response regulator CheB